jgi:hypothetical protein
MSALSASKLPDGVRVDWPEAHLRRGRSPGVACLCGPRTCQLSLVTDLLASLLQASLCNGALFSSRDNKGKGREASLHEKLTPAARLFSFTLSQRPESGVASG